MSANETMNVSETGASKAGNLERHSLLAPSLRELAEHYGRGSLKYDDHNWRKGMEWSLLFDAMMRHAWEFWHGEDRDEETGSKHIIATAWHALSLATYMDECPELDDRPMAPVRVGPLDVIEFDAEGAEPEPWVIVKEDDVQWDTALARVYANVVPVDDEPYGRHVRPENDYGIDCPPVVVWYAPHFVRLQWGTKLTRVYAGE
jgi:hypothetical protein